MFRVAEEEIPAYHKWLAEHSDCFNKPMGAIGGAVTHMFTNTSLGRCYWVRCNICKKEQDLTDYSGW